MRRRLEFCHTPKHGSWLNIAENELSSMTRQSITGRRFGTVEELCEETAAAGTTIATPDNEVSIGSSRSTTPE